MIILDKIDQEDLKELHDATFPLPDLLNPTYIAGRTIIDNGKVVAIGILKVTTEAVLITNERAPHITRGRAVKALVNELEIELRKRRLQDCHIFVKQHHVQRFLRGLGFVDCNAGNPMVIQL